jgi:hypothetical protein
MGLATERHVTHDHRVLNRAVWSARRGRQMRLGLLLSLLVPPGAPLILGADDTVERRSGRRITATGCYRDAVRSTQKPVIHGFGFTWVSRMRLVPVPWARRVWARPLLTALGRPAAQQDQRRHKTRVDWVRQMIQHVRRWVPARQLVLVVEGGFAAVSLAWACVTHQVAMVSRWRWDAARYHPPGPQPSGKRGPNPLQGTRQRRLQAWAARADTPWADVEVVWYGGQRKKVWVVSHTALWYTRGLPPVNIRSVLVCDPEGKLRMAAFFCTALQATPTHILEGVVMRWSVEVTFAEARAHLGMETQRQCSDHAIARTTPVLLALFALVTVLALRLTQGGKIPVPVTAWYHTAEPTFSDCLARVRWHLWRAQYVVNSTPEAACRQCPRGALELLIHSIPLAA